MAYSATALAGIANFTEIRPGDQNFVATAKFASGLLLKTTAAVFAALETAVSAALLIAATPLYFFANKTFVDLTKQTTSAAKTILNATAALAAIHASEKKAVLPTPKPKIHRSHLKNAIAYVQGALNDAIQTIKKSPLESAVVIGGAILVIALCYNYSSILSYSQETRIDLDGSLPAGNLVKGQSFPTGTPEALYIASKANAEEFLRQSPIPLVSEKQLTENPISHLIHPVKSPPHLALRTDKPHTFEFPMCTNQSATERVSEMTALSLKVSTNTSATAALHQAPLDQEIDVFEKMPSWWQQQWQWIRPELWRNLSDWNSLCHLVKAPIYTYFIIKIFNLRPLRSLR